jgi:PPOX class probable F420-dependent enzyme
METWARKLLFESRLAHLATSTTDGVPHVVPICYVFDGHTIYSSIDEKPKRTAPRRLRRMLNIRANPHVSLVVDSYSDDWKKLRYILVRGIAETIPKGREHNVAVALLREKYIQYRSMNLEGRPIIRIRPTKVIAWRPGESTSAQVSRTKNLSRVKSNSLKITSG